MNEKSIAFTLAEVLIVVMIMGIVAELTIPTLIKNIQTAQTVGMLKKEYSVLSQAYNMAVQDNGTPDNWGITDYSGDETSGSKNIINKMSPYLKIMKNCGTGSGCFADNYSYLNNSTWQETDNNLYKVLLADGTGLSAWSGSANCSMATAGAVNLGLHNVCGSLEVDINGTKKPNTDGKDYFVFWLTKYGVIPNGSADLPPTNGNSFEYSCANKNGSIAGHGCTAWVIYNENMDYLHCSNLAWDGNKTCQ